GGWPPAIPAPAATTSPTASTSVVFRFMPGFPDGGTVRPGPRCSIGRRRDQLQFPGGAGRRGCGGGAGNRGGRGMIGGVVRAGKDPIRMMEACLAGYSREVKGFRAVLEKEETNAGQPYPRERIRLSVKGETPNPADPTTGEKPKVHVRMVWEQGARSAIVPFP